MKITPGIRKRDAESTRARIIECAQQIFTEKGYDAAGIREIAACAGVNAALIPRYFGSKRQLFEDAVLPHFNIDAMLAVDTPDLIEEIVGHYIGKEPDHHKTFDPMTALLKSAASTDVRDVIADAIAKRVVAPIAEKIGGEEAETRAAMIVACLGGFDLFRRIIGLDAMSGARTASLSVLLKKALETAADPTGH